MKSYNTIKIMSIVALSLCQARNFSPYPRKIVNASSSVYHTPVVIYTCIYLVCVTSVVIYTRPSDEVEKDLRSFILLFHNMLQNHILFNIYDVYLVFRKIHTRTLISSMDLQLGVGGGCIHPIH